MKLIKKIKQSVFLNIKDKEAIHIDFNPFIDGCGLKGNFVLLHWNRLFRQYGFYDSSSDSYIVHPAHLTIINSQGTLGEVFPDFRVLPTACIIYLNSKIEYKEHTLIIRSIRNA